MTCLAAASAAAAAAASAANFAAPKADEDDAGEGRGASTGELEATAEVAPRARDTVS